MIALLVAAKLLLTVALVSCLLLFAYALSDFVDEATTPTAKVTPANSVGRFGCLLIAPALVLVALLFGDRGDFRGVCSEVWQVVWKGQRPLIKDDAE